MGKNTPIAWADHSWNPWQGCHPVSEGCARCYMYREKRRYGQDPAVVVRSTDATFRKPLHWHEHARVFTCSWSDFFIEEADPWRDEAWDIIRQTPHLTYLILTKRVENVPSRLPADWPWENVWLGVTAENQARADERIPLLLRTPAAVRFVSCEPLLGPINLCPSWYDWYNGPHWIIAGGESGPGARPMHPDWARSLRDQCETRDVPFFMKQWGEYVPTGQASPEVVCSSHHEVYLLSDGTTADRLNYAAIEMNRVGKAKAGDLLDGRQWHQFPSLKGQ